MRVLVTGGAGFIGGNLARALVAEGHEVRCYDNLGQGRREAVPPEADLIEADLRDQLALALASKGSDVIFHQGALRSVARSIDYPEETMDVNVRGSMNVLLAAREAGAAVVFASSSSVYGDRKELPLREDMALRPKSPYAASKVAAESYCRAFSHVWKVPTVCLRYFNVYGPGQDPSSEYALVIPLFIRACLEGSRPEIHGDGQQSRDFTYIDDVVQANFRAARAPESAFGEAFNVGAGDEPTSISDLLGEIARVTGSKPDVISLPARAGDVRHTKADVTRARQVLGYAPQYRLREGLERSIEYFRSAP